MLVLNTNLITKTGGLYNLQADQNLTELKTIMKDILVKERPTGYATAISADSKPTTATVSTQTAPAGGRLWAKTGVYGPRKKKEPRVKTFAL
ncbi:hypothetical protein PF002_g20241 [Phytophthora fragariae]|uniref:Uncharacterized protein n=1 Tax=Phytophthora fragariae TaxID=53985 RepID=A0A6A3XY83_9STRA|nr:hypothetical protein PF002_g20241 [Phytophthora fragariae]